VEHPKFEGYVMPIEDEYQNLSGLKLRQWVTLTFDLAFRWAFRWAKVRSKSRLKSKSKVISLSENLEAKFTVQVQT